MYVCSQVGVFFTQLLSPPKKVPGTFSCSGWRGCKISCNPETAARQVSQFPVTSTNTIFHHVQQITFEITWRVTWLSISLVSAVLMYQSGGGIHPGGGGGDMINYTNKRRKSDRRIKNELLLVLPLDEGRCQRHDLISTTDRDRRTEESSLTSSVDSRVWSAPWTAPNSKAVLCNWAYQDFLQLRQPENSRDLFLLVDTFCVTTAWMYYCPILI